MKIALSLVLVCFPVSAFSAAPPFPDRPIRIVVPFAPGGGSDYLMRVIAPKMPEVFAQNGIVDNRPGAAGILGTLLVANAPNDGYTVLIADTPFAANQNIYAKAGYDPIKSFTPITQLATTPLILVINPGLQAASVQEFIALAKSQPGRLAIGNSGGGSITHIAASLFSSSTGTDLTTVPYKGTGPALTDVVAGQVHAIIATAPSVMGLIKGGKLRALAVTSAKRSPLAPELPTMQEAGVRGYVISNWYILVAPANTPQPVIAKLHSGFVKIVEQSDIRDRLSAAIMEVTPSPTPHDLALMISSEVARLGRVVKDAGIRVE